MSTSMTQFLPPLPSAYFEGQNPHPPKAPVCAHVGLNESTEKGTAGIPGNRTWGLCSGEQIQESDKDSTLCHCP